MKKVIALLLALIMVLCGFVGCGEKEESQNGGNQTSNEEFFEWSRSEEGLITGYSSLGLKQKHIVIPAKCTAFNYTALSENDTVEQITFESGFSLEVLSEYLFSQCTSLKSVQLPNSITVIPQGLFFGCTNLESVDIPENVTVIEKSAFKDCTNLKSVNMGDKVAVIEKEAFRICEKLQTIKLSAALTTIEENAFRSNNELKDIAFPDSLRSIGEYAFFNCHALQTVKLPEGMETLESFAFVYCDGLNEIYLPSTLTQLDDSAFGQTHEIAVYVKKGSLADVEFENYQDGSMSKEYY